MPCTRARTGPMTMRTVTRRITPLMLRRRLRAEGVLFRAYRCWSLAATWTRLPRRKDLAELEELPSRAWIGVAEAQAASGLFRYRSLGSEMLRLGLPDTIGGSVGGATDPSPFGDLDRAAFLESAFQERIVFSRRQLAAPAGDPLRIDCLVLPLCAEQPGTAIVLFAQDFNHGQDSRRRAAERPTGPIVETERLSLSAMDPAHEHQSSVWLAPSYAGQHHSR